MCGLLGSPGKALTSGRCLKNEQEKVIRETITKYMTHSLYGEHGVIHDGEGSEWSPYYVDLNTHLATRDIQGSLRGTPQPVKELGPVVVQRDPLHVCKEDMEKVRFLDLNSLSLHRFISKYVPQDFVHTSKNQKEFSSLVKYALIQ